MYDDAVTLPSRRLAHCAVIRFSLVRGLRLRSDIGLGNESLSVYGGNTFGRFTIRPSGAERPMIIVRNPCASSDILLGSMTLWKRGEKAPGFGYA